MNWQEIITDYLTFTRKERIGIVIIILLIIGVVFVPKIISNSSSGAKPTATDSAWVKAMKSLEIKDSAGSNETSYRKYNDDNSSSYQYDRSKNNYSNAPKGELFYFDPNTLSTEGWEKLGLRNKTIHTIQNYLSKGGHFKKPEDLQKIYGLFPSEYERLSPYIKIEIAAEAENREQGSKKTDETISFKTPAARYATVEINQADTTAFIALPGIGSKLAARIINFRDKLGGFYSVAQIGETFGLPDSTFQKIKQYLKLENTPVKKININKATIDELKAHPYIKYSLANPIIAYRNEHGAFSKVEDIKKVMLVTDEVYNKIAAYLSVQ